MSDILLDVDNEIVLTSGGAELAEGLDAIAQHLKIRFGMWLGEWFADDSVGVPYLDRVFLKNPDLAELRVLFAQIALDTPGVDRLDDFVLSYNAEDRALTVQITGRSDNLGPFVFDTPLVIS